VRILLDYRPALRARTGVGEYLHQIARSIGADRRPDETLTLFSSSWKDRLPSDAVPGARTIDRKLPVRALNFTWDRIGRPPVETVTGETFDVVQSGHPLLIPSRAAAQVIFIADLDFLDRSDRSRVDPKRYAAAVRSHVARADRVLTISEHSAADIAERLDVSRERISIAFPGAPAWPRRPDAERGRHILFLGTLEPRKNVARLLDAYEQLIVQMPGVPPLVLAGGIPADASPLVARASAPPLVGRVTLTGYVDEAQRQALYREAVIFVLPSHTEGFGIPVVEAMTTGVPVVVSNRGALPEVVGDAGRLIDPDDAGSIAHAIRSLLEDEIERRRLADAGAERAKQFTWTRAADAAREAWRLAIEDRKRRG